MPNEKKKYNYYTKALLCPDGSRKYIRGKTQKELDEKVRAAQAELEKGININDNTTFGQFAQMWVDLYKRPYLRPASLTSLLNYINNYMMPVLGQLKVKSIKPAHIVLVMNNIAHLSRPTQSNVLGRMRAIFASAVDNGLIGRSPVPVTMRAGGTATQDKEPLTPEECGVFLATAREYNARLYTFSLLCLYAGLRSSEARGLCWDCVDLTAGTLQVKRQFSREEGNAIIEDLKTPAARRTIPLHPELAAHLRSLKAQTDNIAVCGTMTTRSVDYYFAEMRKKVGFHVHPHLLRHTYATRLVESGLDVKEVQYLLGHTTPTMTLKVYAHYDRKSRAETTAKRVASVSFTA